MVVLWVSPSIVLLKAKITSVLKIAKKQKDKVDFFKLNSPLNYVDQLILIFTGNFKEKINNDNFNNVLQKRRNNYFPKTFRRFLGSLKRYIYKKIQ